MNNMTLPKGYIKGVPRVSEIVSFKFPFKGTEDEKRYLDWLADNVPENRKRGYSINQEEYLKEAQNVGTFIHLQMEKYILGKKINKKHKNFKKFSDLIIEACDYIDNLKSEYKKEDGWIFITEPVLYDKDNRYQGSSDLVLINEKKEQVIIYDWKTFGIAKARWNLPNEYKKPTPKLKKGACQFSLYGETYKQKGYKVLGIRLVYLHYNNYTNKRGKNICNYGIYEYELKQWTTSEINKLLKDFYLDYNQKNITITNITDMIVEIRKPTEQYGYVNITIDMYKEKDGKTLEEKISEAKKIINFITKK